MKRRFAKIIASAIVLVMVLMLFDGCEKTAIRMLPTTQYDTENPLTTEQMKQDLDFLETWLGQNHVNAWHSISKAKFHATVQALESHLDGMTRTQYEYEILKLVALIGEDHTNASLTSSYTSSRRELTFEAMSFDDGWYITKVDVGHSSYLGWRIDRINGFNRAQITKMVKPFISSETEAWTQYLMLNYVNNWDVLYLAGTVDDKSVTLTLSKAGKTEEVVFTAMQHIDAYDLSYVTLLAQNGYKEIETCSSNEAYRFFGYDDLFFVQYNLCKNTANYNMNNFVSKLEEKQTEKNYKNLVIDLRYNEGGMSDVTVPLVEFANDFVHSGGKLYVLIGEKTCSSGIWAMVDLQPYVSATIGKPTGGGVNHYGNVGATVVLENSCVYVQCSTRWIQKTPGSKIASAQPDITAKHTFDDYFNGIDPELAAVRKLISGQ